MPGLPGGRAPCGFRKAPWQSARCDWPPGCAGEGARPRGAGSRYGKPHPKARPVYIRELGILNLQTCDRLIAGQTSVLNADIPHLPFCGSCAPEQVQARSVSGALLTLRLLGRTVPVSCSFWCCWPSSASLGLWTHRSSLCLVPTWSSPFLRVCVQIPLLQARAHWLWGPPHSGITSS